MQLLRFSRPVRLAGAFVLTALLSSAARNDPALAPGVQSMLARISADSMKGHVSFLASDLLEGRATPSPGLEIAAEYIAAQFRRAGLEPAGDDGYFQTAKFVALEQNAAGFRLNIDGPDARMEFGPSDVRLHLSTALDIADAAAFKVALEDPVAATGLKPVDIRGKVLTVFASDSTARTSMYRTLTAVRKLSPALVIAVGPDADRIASHQKLFLAGDAREDLQVIAVRNSDLERFVRDAPPGPMKLYVSAHAAAPIEHPVTLRNVVGVVRGSDAVLKDSYVLVSAHYDHVGANPGAAGDRIYNGANDDASGVASLIEVASALATLDPKPRRSIAFIALFGEEEGLLGSRYYGRHPVFPLTSTVAAINLEQLGRTDATDGAKLASASFTGFNFSDIPAIFQKAGEKTGINVYRDAERSDAFFARSDNQALADLGIPAHTICVAFEYPDYHGVGDEWPKLDYDNMAKVDRMIALGLLMIADGETTPRWNAGESKTSKYEKAWERLRQPAGGTP
jgi:hypothetical protein